MLADELGLEPGPELRRLQEAILAHDPAIAAVPVVRRRRGNLPAPSTSFVGREDELGQVAALLHEHRLVTLTGPPGVGKSRLAVETARSLEHEFPDGIWLVDFARAGGAADAVRLLAHAVDVRGSDPLARVTSRLRDAAALVVLDACEHVLDEAARIASTLLAECPAGPDPGDEPRGAPRRERGETPRGAARGRGCRALPRACARGTARIRAGRRGRRARRRDRPARRRIAAGDRARRRARERARSRGARLHPRAARGAPARQPGLRPGPHRAARARGMELRPLARGREDAAPAARRPPRRRVPAVARRARSEARPQRGDRRVSRCRAGRQVDRVGLVHRRRRSLRHARHGPRVRARASRRERRARRRPRRARRILRGTRRRGARRAARAGMAALGTPPGAGERQSLGCAGVRSRRARPCRRGSARHVGVVLRAGRPRLRGTALPRARPLCHGR